MIVATTLEKERTAREGILYLERRIQEIILKEQGENHYTGERIRQKVAFLEMREFMILKEN